MKKNFNLFLTISLILLSFSAVYAKNGDELQINNFILKETLSQNGKLAIIACDSLEKPLEINGTFQFTMNGFSTPLSFQDGVAITPNKIENSTFVYLQHLNSRGNHSLLFYVLKKDNALQVYKINWLLLLMIPIGILILIMLFKRFLWIGIILMGVYLYYNAQKGLNIGSFLEIILEGVKNIL